MRPAAMTREACRERGRAWPRASRSRGHGAGGGLAGGRGRPLRLGVGRARGLGGCLQGWLCLRERGVMR